MGGKCVCREQCVELFSVGRRPGTVGRQGRPQLGEREVGARGVLSDAAAEKRSASFVLCTHCFFSFLSPAPAPPFKPSPPWTTPRCVPASCGLRVWGWAVKARRGRAERKTLPHPDASRAGGSLVSAVSFPFFHPPCCHPAARTFCRLPMGAAACVPPVFFAPPRPKHPIRVLFVFCRPLLLPTPPSTPQVERQIDQMVRFIRQEAEEKAAEIGVSAEEVRFGRGEAGSSPTHPARRLHPHSLSLPSYHTQHTSTGVQHRETDPFRRRESAPWARVFAPRGRGRGQTQSGPL